MIYRLLGELAVGRDGQRLPLPGGHALRVLAALMINANRQLSKEDLLRVSWGQVEIDETQLHKAVSAVRVLLGKVGRRGDLKTYPRSGYELRATKDDLDMLLFLWLVRQAEEVATTSAEQEADLLRQALGLWRGSRPLANVPTEALQVEIEELRQRRKRAAVRLYEVEVGRRRSGAVLDDLSVIAGQYPTDRRLCELLMIALCRGGDTTEALAAYERHAAALEQATRARPEPGLSKLRYAIASGDESLVAEHEAALAQRSTRAEPPQVLVPRELPPAPGDFVGRDTLVAEARWLLGRHSEPATTPVVVISGPGGIGKTALAAHVAHLVHREQFPDGQLYIELRATAGQSIDTEEVLAHALRSLGVATLPATRAERAATFRSLVADRRVLVVLDDVLDEDQISDLIPANPRCGVIITARRPLPGLTGAHHLPPLEPLGSSVATKLFLRVIRRAGLEPQDDLAATERVVALCSGLPLAIRIAAALRVREVGRPTADLADRLARQGPEGFNYGELSVARSIGASFDRLDPAARRLFLGLGLARLPDFGGWTAAAVLDDRGANQSGANQSGANQSGADQSGADQSGVDESGVDTAGALSQVVAAFIGQPSGAPMRFRFHDLTQEYAYRRAIGSLTRADDRVGVPYRVYRALLTLARRAHRAIYGGDFEVVHSGVPDWEAPAAVVSEVDRSPMTWFDAERHNIRAAVTHAAALGLVELCWDLAISTHEYYTLSGHFDDWHATHAEALRACRAAGDLRGEGVVLTILGQPALAASRRGGVVSGPAELRRAVELLAECGDRHGQAIALRTLANALRRRGQLAGPLRMFAEARGHYEASGDALGSWLALRFIGQTQLDLGELEAALEVLESAREAAERLGKAHLLAQTGYWIGQVHLASGDLARAEAEFAVVLAAFPDATGAGHAYAAHGFGDVARRRGDLPAADRHLGAAARLAQEFSDAGIEGRVHLSLAAVRRDQGQAEAAVAALEHAADCFAGSGAPFHQAAALAALAETQTSRGETGGARLAWRRVRRLYDEMDLPTEDRIHHPPPATPGPGATES